MEDLSFDHILLEPVQKELLSQLVEAARRMPRDRREKFSVQRSRRGGVCVKNRALSDLEIEVYMGDIKWLDDMELISLSRPDPRGAPYFDLTPIGLEYYTWMKQREGQPVQRIEVEIRTYLNTNYFQQRYQVAYQKWAEAETMLWSSDSEQQFTMIGHLCREAMQEFATALVERYQPPGVDEKKASTKNRLKAVLEQHADRLGKTERPFINALIDYWEAFEQLIQRQEHGGQREKEPLVWEDGRRVVFQTAIVMYEVDKTLSLARRG